MIINTFTDWNKVVHNNIPFDQLVEDTASRDVTNEQLQLQLQTGSGNNLAHSIAYEYFGEGPINWFINNLPFEAHLRDSERKIKYNFAGPGTKLEKRLNPDGTPKEWSKPINKLDEAAYHHDLAYRDNKTAEGRHPADLALAAAAERIAQDPTASKDERKKANLVAAAMRGKLYLGAGTYGNGIVDTISQYATPENLSMLYNAVSGLYDFVGKKNENKKKEAEKAKKESAKTMFDKYKVQKINATSIHNVVTKPIKPFPMPYGNSASIVDNEGMVRHPMFRKFD